MRRIELHRSLVLTLVVLLSGCALPLYKAAGMPTPSVTAKTLPVVPTQQPSPSPVQTQPSQIPTIPPTIDPAQESFFLSLLQPTGCNLPCYIGISPGKTSWADAQSILKEIGAIPDGPLYGMDEGMPEFGFYFYIGDPSLINATPRPTEPLETTGIVGYLDITVGNDLVQRLAADTQTTRLVDKYHKYWSRYTLGNIFKDLGPPDLIFFGIQSRSGGYLQSIVYSKLGILISMDGIKMAGMICPTPLTNSGSANVGIGIQITNPNSSLNIYGSGVPPTDRSIYLPIQESLGINITQFYQRVIADPTSCFKIKEMLP